MNTKKRNERTRRIFNGVMRAVMLAYGIRDDDIRNISDMYTLLYTNNDRVFYFLDKNGKIIDNSLPYRDGDFIDFRGKVNNGRKLKFYYSNEYNRYMDKHYQTGGDTEYLDNAESLIKTISIDDCKYNRYQYGIDDCSSLDRRHEFYDGICSDSTFLRKLFRDYIEEQHNKNNYKCLVMFEGIFGCRCFTRREFDRIRYIFFTTNNNYTPDHIYDIDYGHFHFFSGIINSIIDSTHQNYNLNVYKSIFDNVFYILKDISKSYDICSFSEIKNKLLTEYTKRVKVEDMDLVDLEKARLEELAYEYNFTALTHSSGHNNDECTFIPQQEETNNDTSSLYDHLMKMKESFDRLGIRGFNF